MNLLFYIFLTFQVCNALRVLRFDANNGSTPVKTFDGVDYIEMEQNEPLKLDCMCFGCDEYVNFNHWRLASIFDGLQTIPQRQVSFGVSNNSPVSSLRFLSTSNISGLYVCSTKKRELDSIKVHVFVKDKSFFVPLQTYSFLTSGDSVVVPCRATRFDTNATLFIDGNRVDTQYNPMIGFTIKRQQLEGKVAECRFNDEKVSFTIKDDNCVQEVSCPDMRLDWVYKSNGFYSVNCISPKKHSNASLVAELKPNKDLDDVIYRNMKDGSVQLSSTAKINNLNISCRCYEEDFLKSERVFQRNIDIARTEQWSYLLGFFICAMIVSAVVFLVTGPSKRPNFSPMFMKMVIPSEQLKVHTNEPAINNGSHGIVYNGTLWNLTRTTDFSVAVKASKSPEFDDDLNREALMYSILPPHRNIVEVFGFCISDDQQRLDYIVFMKYDRQSLCELLQTLYPSERDDELLFLSNTGSLIDVPLCLFNLISMVWQLCRGVMFLHAQEIVHGDINSRNILITTSYICKLADFGKAKITKEVEDYLKDIECLKSTALEIFRLGRETSYCPDDILALLSEDIPSTTDFGDNHPLKKLEAYLEEKLQGLNEFLFLASKKTLEEPFDETFLEKIRVNFRRAHYERTSAFPRRPLSRSAQRLLQDQDDDEEEEA